MSSTDAVFKFLDAAESAIIDLETSLTAIPALAPESGGDGEWKKAEVLERWLRAKGLTNIEHFDAPDARVSAGKRPNLVATIKGREPGARLWIMAHTDVVPEGDRGQWQTDPFQAVIKGGKIYGRGVEDNQQGLVSSVMAALALLDAKLVPEHDVKLLFVADEEFGSVYGIQYLLANATLFAKDDLIIIPDGGKPDGSEINTAEKNICWLKVRTTGKQCHASVPDDGANPFLANCDLAVRLHDMETEVFTDRSPLFSPDRSTITPTKKEANVPNINTVPAEDIFYLDMRVLPQYKVKLVVAEAGKRARLVEAKYGVTVNLEVVMENESPPTPLDTPVVGLLRSAIKATCGIDARPIGIGGGTVGAYLRNAGFDCVVWSTQDETMHAPNEYTKIANIIGDAKVFARLMLRQA
ncbi:MAG: diaminopimelate aminotransferase [Spirochaetes bacterium GWD1_61_31]|nr:MAG: diaminopimelate aminotransferase [Spirochaetes bacterium GWB1_60_80]OHD30816.1 MAG: diaminopimelate aminotransferase [Spirochaetes bacterium GWC1_61_12]OHD36393.1 MAG: diaminopimelate aminotransferase [Spirochaetes bacterium GWD1_61_31]OHD46316.1 MAG: diaminopimelate aminotransferase [Spirochaetes bacterium GWE1_60_18]OHD60923.1 MAG: diaminopimelate aminotransferase [Spirochaetes bacterium GWF1_60_12]HAP42819.1 diaminopimelate aminotransferase [Spirochaetaceae bacterium]